MFPARYHPFCLKYSILNFRNCRPDVTSWWRRDKAVSFKKRLACVASVSVGLSARWRRFLLFGCAKIGASATLMEAAGRGGKARKGNACPQTPWFWKTPLCHFRSWINSQFDSWWIKYFTNNRSPEDTNLLPSKSKQTLNDRFRMCGKFTVKFETLSQPGKIGCSFFGKPFQSVAKKGLLWNNFRWSLQSG